MGYFKVGNGGTYYSVSNFCLPKITFPVSIGVRDNYLPTNHVPKPRIKQESGGGGRGVPFSSFACCPRSCSSRYNPESTVCSILWI